MLSLRALPVYNGRHEPSLPTKEALMFPAAPLSDLPAFCVGHAHDACAGTGCTVVVAPEGAVCGVDVRGGGPATRETDLLKPENMIEAVHAVVLSGGSAFGLEASCGVMDALAERGIGFPVGTARVPIVVGACLFDLLIGDPVHPDKAMGRFAAECALAAYGRRQEAPGPAAAASAGEASDPSASPAAQGAEGAQVCSEPPLAQGNVGAGCGATVGKLGQDARAMKSGFGWACLRAGDVVAAALVAVNALGCVRDAEGAWIAGVRDEAGRVMDPLAALASSLASSASPSPSATPGGPCENTTIGVVLTNAKLTKAQATKVSSTVHDAYARAIKPVHTSNDGDTVFTFASGEASAPTDLVAVLATEAMQQAIVAAVANAEGAFGLPAARDLA